MNNLLILRLRKLPFLPPRCAKFGTSPQTGGSGAVSGYGRTRFGVSRKTCHLHSRGTVLGCQSVWSNRVPSVWNNCRLLSVSQWNPYYRAHTQAKHFSHSAPLASDAAPSTSAGSTAQLPTKAKVVVCGGGAIGSSIAFHLAKEGWTDVVLLEQGSLTSGTTWHAAGLIGGLRSRSADAAICNYSLRLYKELEEEGYYLGLKQCGALTLARTRDRVIAYKRAILNSERFGLKGEFLSPDEVKERLPLLNTSDLEGGFWIPTDAVASPPDVALALAKKGKELGVQVVEGCKVTKVLTKKEKVTGVETNLGTMECQYFVNAAGMWARELGQLSTPTVRVPLHPCEHFYIVTKTIEGVDPMMPVVRDYDGFVYLREWGGGLLAGGFEPRGKPVFHDGIPDKFEFQLLPEDWDHFQILLEQMLHRVPALSQAQVRQLTNGPESFTPDGKSIMGRSPEIENYFVAAGMNSAGIAAAGGVGKVMAEWIINSEPSMDMWSNDIRRFVDLHNNKKFLKDRVAETLGTVEQVSPNIHPNNFLKTGRRVRTSPIFPRLEEYSAVFGPDNATYEKALFFQNSGVPELFGNHNVATPFAEDYKSGRLLRTSPIYPRLEKHGVFDQVMAYERAVFYQNTPSQDDFSEAEEDMTNSFGKPAWFDKVKAEYWACREGVCLIDMSTFTKFELRSAGEEVVNFLQYVCSNDIDKPVGTVIHTGMQNENGGYENDCSVVRMASNRYFMISPTAQQTRSFAWLKDHLPADGSVQLSDVTSMYTAINVLGPKSPELLAQLTDANLSKQEFGHMTCREIDVGQASGIKAMRLTHSGEEGWMLYIPSEYALHVYDSLIAAGADYGIRNAGYYALRALRTEKFFAYWGTDLTPHSTPLECGREYRVKLAQGGFLGHEALIKQRNAGIKKRLVQFVLEDHDVHSDLWPWSGEPILRNGVHCGTTTSTSYGFTLQKFVCLGYVHDIDEKTGQMNNISMDYLLKNAKYEINIAGERFTAKPAIYPPTLPPAGIVIN